MKLKTLTLFLLLAISFSCNNKKTDAQSDLLTDKDSLTDLDYLEGKVVQSTTGEWFVIKDGYIWKTRSETATNDYLKSIENGENHILKNVPQTTLEQLIIAGEILPNLEFKTVKESEPTKL